MGAEEEEALNIKNPAGIRVQMTTRQIGTVASGLLTIFVGGTYWGWKILSAYQDGQETNARGLATLSERFDGPKDNPSAGVVGRLVYVETKCRPVDDLASRVQALEARNQAEKAETEARNAAIATEIWTRIENNLRRHR